MEIPVFLVLMLFIASTESIKCQIKHSKERKTYWSVLEGKMTLQDWTKSCTMLWDLWVNF